MFSLSPSKSSAGAPGPDLSGEGGADRLARPAPVHPIQEGFKSMAKKAAPKAAESKPPEPAKAAAPAPKAAAPKAEAKAAAPKKAATKSEIFAALAEKTGLKKADVASVFAAMSEAIAKDLGKKGAGIFTVPGLLKLKVVRKAATKEKQGVNPFNGQPMTIKAKPARNVIKAYPLKALKDLV